MDSIQEILNYPLLTFSNPEGEVSFHLDIWMVLLSILSFLVVKYVLKFIQKILTKNMDAGKKANFNTLFKFIGFFIYFMVLLFVLQATGMNVTAILAASTALFLGVGLALQDFLKDIVAGVTILVEKSVNIGDILEIEDKVVKIQEVNIRTTQALTRDKKILLIPNHLFLTNTIYNYTQNDESTREEIQLKIVYGTDLEVVKEIMIKSAQQHPLVLQEPKPSVDFVGFDDFSLNLKLYFYIQNAFNSPRIESDLRFLVEQQLKQQKIPLAFSELEAVSIKPNPPK